MTFIRIILAAAVLFFGSGLCGCGNGDDGTDPGDDSSIVEPMEDYREDAEREITPETADEELDRLEEEIEKDIGSGN